MKTKNKGITITQGKVTGYNLMGAVFVDHKDPLKTTSIIIKLIGKYGKLVFIEDQK